MPKRRQGETYWTEEQFEKLRTGEAANLVSKGNLPWRLLAYMLLQDPDLQKLREMVGRRLLDSAQIERAQVQLNQMLVTLWTAGYIELEPRPRPKAASPSTPGESKSPESAAPQGLLAAAGLGDLVEKARQAEGQHAKEEDKLVTLDEDAASRGYELKDYKPQFAHPTDRLELLVRIRSINPLYAVFLAGHLAIADDTERLLALESALDLSGTVARSVRPPKIEELPPGPLATERLDHQLLELGLASQEELIGKQKSEEEDERRTRRGSGVFEEEPVFVLSIGEKLRRLFNYDFPKVHDVRTTAVHVAGEVLEFEGDFNKYIIAKKLQKQEGIVFPALVAIDLATR